MSNILMLYHFAPHTTANYLARAFKALGHDIRTAGTMAVLQGFTTPYRLWGPHTYPLADNETLDIERLDGWKPDLVLWVESGQMGTRRMFDLVNWRCPTAAYFIDSHNPDKLKWHKRAAGLFDYRFEAMLPWVEELGATWLPLACDPEIHTPRTYSEDYDLAWVGGPWGEHPMYEKRFHTLRLLSTKYKCAFKSGVYFEDMADVYGSAKIGWHMSVMGGDLDMRVFEILCSGRPLVCDTARESGLWDIVPIIQCGATYDNEAAMFRAIDWLRNEPGLAAQIAKAARQIALDLHTYQHRAHSILQTVGLE
jgi:hypothetical protein